MRSDVIHSRNFFVLFFYYTVELEALKHSPSSIGLRHRRESFNSNTPSLHSQQFNIPTAPSPAPSFHSMASSHYPGVVTDMIREIRESMKNREDSMMSRVKTIVDEKTWTSSDLNMRLIREFEDIKVSLTTKCFRRTWFTPCGYYACANHQLIYYNLALFVGSTP